MASLRELLRFLEQPRVVRRIGRGDERKRTPERVRHFLVMPVVTDHPARTPRPVRRELPVGDVWRKQFGRARRHHAPIYRTHAFPLTSTISTLVSFTLFARDCDLPSPRLDQPSADCESQPTSRRARGKMGLEDSGQHCRRDTGSVVHCLDRDPSFFVANRDLDLTGAREPRVLEDVEKHVAHSSFCAIAQTGRSAPRSCHFTTRSPICSSPTTSLTTAATSTSTAGGRSAGALP